MTQIHKSSPHQSGDLYPPLEPFAQGLLKVSKIHEIYYEQCGNPNGIPIVFLHGGPGGGCSPTHRQFFDPKKFHIVLFDQRGCGRSLPFAELRENTTWDLVEDIEKLRNFLKVQSWHVFGGSWGSTLALAYAETHPSRVLSLILRGIFLCRRDELTWLYQDGANQIFPDQFEPYWNFIPPHERGDMMSAYYRRLTGPDEDLKLKAAQVWSIWEAATSCLHIKSSMMEEFEDPKKALPFARIESHYFVHGGFLESDRQLLDQVSRIQNIPGVIVQGRYDVVCPMKNAWELHTAWKKSRLVVVPDAGHSAFEPGIQKALVQACDAIE